MEIVRFGSTDLLVSRLCLGCMSFGSKTWRPWVLPEEESRPFIRTALEAGINFFDTADMYSRGVSEEIVGRAIRDFSQREKVVIATKVFFPMGDGPADRGLSRAHISRAIEDSLRRLGTEYVDLYQIHRWDYETPIEETLEALDSLVRLGKVRYIGASSMFLYQFAAAIQHSENRGLARFESMQNHYNLVYREEEREMIPYCVQKGIAVMPWSPLARGFLTGSRKKGVTTATPREASDTYAHELYYDDGDYEIADRTANLAAKRGVSPAEIALAWLLHQPGVTAPIIGSTKIQHIKDAVAAVDLKLDVGERVYLEEAYRPHKVLGHR